MFFFGFDITHQKDRIGSSVAPLCHSASLPRCSDFENMMFKRSASRNQRPKSVRAKQVLQILLLLGICFWLVYQVKYSHDKKREINEKDSRISGKEKGGDDLKFGRKELRPRYQKHKEEDEEQEKKVVVEDEEEEGNKLEEDEQEETSIIKHEVEEEEEKEDENIVGGVQLEDVKAREEGDSEEDEKEEEEEVKSDEPEDHERAREGEEGEEVEVKELENQEQEKPQDEGDRNEEFIDEEKEKEEEPFDEKENEGNDEEVKESQVENENEVNDATTLDDEVSHHGAHEAREEQYKGDDASSAVTHDETTETKELDKSSVAGTIDVEGQQDTSNSSSEVEKNSANGSDSLIQNSTNETETNIVLPDTDLANSTETMLSVAHGMENATAVNTTLTKNEEDRSSTDPEHEESSGNTNSDVGSVMKGDPDGILKLPSNANSRDKESDGQNEAGSGVGTN